ncbi:hypothetical protein BU17DRAFT_70737 [Hysterangium stoloniferum]|nr:hypothetical protein BU17DRAFT_70737 [Hysterangium stoloniferum]
MSTLNLGSLSSSLLHHRWHHLASSPKGRPFHKTGVVKDIAIKYPNVDQALIESFVADFENTHLLRADIECLRTRWVEINGGSSPPPRQGGEVMVTHVRKCPLAQWIPPPMVTFLPGPLKTTSATTTGNRSRCWNLSRKNWTTATEGEYVDAYPGINYPLRPDPAVWSSEDYYASSDTSSSSSDSNSDSDILLGNNDLEMDDNGMDRQAPTISYNGDFYLPAYEDGSRTSCQDEGPHTVSSLLLSMMFDRPVWLCVSAELSMDAIFACMSPFADAVISVKVHCPIAGRAFQKSESGFLSQIAAR